MVLALSADNRDRRLRFGSGRIGRSGYTGDLVSVGEREELLVQSYPGDPVSFLDRSAEEKTRLLISVREKFMKVDYVAGRRREGKEFLPATVSASMLPRWGQHQSTPQAVFRYDTESRSKKDIQSGATKVGSRCG